MGGDDGVAVGEKDNDARGSWLFVCVRSVDFEEVAGGGRVGNGSRRCVGRGGGQNR